MKKMTSNEARTKFTEFLNSISKEPILVTKSQLPHGVFMSVEDLERNGWARGAMFANSEGYLSADDSTALIKKILNPASDAEEDSGYQTIDQTDYWRRTKRFHGELHRPKRDMDAALSKVENSIKIKLSQVAFDTLQNIDFEDANYVAERILYLAADPQDLEIQSLGSSASAWQCHTMFHYGIVFKAEYGLFRVVQIWKRNDVEAVLHALLRS